MDDVKAYISSSKYRIHVLTCLAETGEATPQEIAEQVDDPRPHVSRALSELREKDVVELRVPEARSMGRYYGLTPKGEEAWPEIRERTQNVEWSMADSPDPHVQSVVELAESTFGEGLRVVGVYDGESVTIPYADPDVVAQYTEEEFEQGIRSVVLDHSLDEFEIPDQECQSEVIHFEDFSVVNVRVTNRVHVSVSFSNSEEASVSAFAESATSLFDA